MGERITPLNYKKLIKVFEKLGLKVERIEGDHFIMSKPGIKRPVVIQKRKDVSISHIKANIDSAGVTRKEYLDILKSI